MALELTDPTGTLLGEIAREKSTRNTVAEIFALALQSSAETDWGTVYRAIVRRWSPSAVGYIRRRARSMIPAYEEEEEQIGIGDQ